MQLIPMFLMPFHVLQRTDYTYTQLAVVVTRLRVTTQLFLSVQVCSEIEWTSLRPELLFFLLASDGEIEFKTVVKYHFLPD